MRTTLEGERSGQKCVHAEGQASSAGLRALKRIELAPFRDRGHGHVDGGRQLGNSR